MFFPGDICSLLMWRPATISDKCVTVAFLCLVFYHAAAFNLPSALSFLVFKENVLVSRGSFGAAMY